MMDESLVKDTEFEEKVYVIADEVLSILKNLSQENKQQINSTAIAEKMRWNESVKKLLEESAQRKADGSCNLETLPAIIMDRLAGFMPADITGQLSDIREGLQKATSQDPDGGWIEPPAKIIRQYIDSISARSMEFQDFVVQAMNYLEQTEMHIAGEKNAHAAQFRENGVFADDISTNVSGIAATVRDSGDMTLVRDTILSKIEQINRTIEAKKEQDISRLRETDLRIQSMSIRMNELRNEADELRRKTREIEMESIKDALTGLNNRKAYDDKLDETLAHVSRYKINSCLMICDIDHFKKINDTHGHKVGDLALKKLASLLAQRLRKNDFIARYGGEEFAVILPHTDLPGSIKAGEGVRSYIANAIFSYNKKQIPLTISIGVSAFRADDDTTSVFERADRALYLAKNSGRNQVMSELDISDEALPA